MAEKMVVKEDTGPRFGLKEDRQEDLQEFLKVMGVTSKEAEHYKPERTCQVSVRSAQHVVDVMTLTEDGKTVLAPVQRPDWA